MKLISLLKLEPTKTTIILFSRLELTHLYGEISKFVSPEFNVLHLAYSKHEYDILNNKYKISNAIVFKDEIKNIFESEIMDYKLLDSIDKLIIEQTDGRFNLNSSIQSDRTFEGMEYDDCLIMTQVYYKFWCNIIEAYNVKIILHEITALFFLHIAAVICRQKGALYLAQIQVRGENEFGWIFAEGDTGKPIDLINNFNNSIARKDNKRAEKYLKTFRMGNQPLFPALRKIKKSNRKSVFIINVFRDLVKNIYKRRDYHLQMKLYSKSPVDHIERYLLLHQNISIRSIINKWSNEFKLEYDEYKPESPYYYYPMHVEPEAVVLYWGDGLYKNQVKLIENIAAQLKPGHYLYVKIHPLDKVDREYSDYKRIKAIPNVKLISSDISAQKLTVNSKGVITINGTGGYEAILYNKTVYIFGNSIYELSNRVIKVKNIRDLRKLIYDKSSLCFFDDQELINFVNSFLNSVYPGFTLYFRDLKEKFGIDNLENSKVVADGINKFVKSRIKAI